MEDRLDHEMFADLLLASALKAKKLSNDAEEYEIFEEFVFHNQSRADSTGKIDLTEDLSDAEFIELPFRHKFAIWEHTVFNKVLCVKFID